MKLIEAKVLANDEVVESHREIVLKTRSIAEAARPGHFLHVLCGEPPVGDGLRRFLRRPLSIFLVDVERGTTHLLYRVLGEGTQWLASRRPGDTVSFIGPLGNPFPLHERTAVLVGGGVGIPPLYFLARELRAKGVPVRAFLGARTGAGILAAGDFRRLGVSTAVATDDGSAGHRGLVTDLLDRCLMEEGGEGPSPIVYACGPSAMLRAVQGQVASRNLPAYLSLEERMACGVGACLGCPCMVPGEEPYPSQSTRRSDLPSSEELTARYDRVRRAAGGEAAVTYRRVCLEGPVFPAWDVVLTRHPCGERGGGG